MADLSKASKLQNRYHDDIMPGVAISTSADTPFRSFVQTQICSDSPWSFT